MNRVVEVLYISTITREACISSCQVDQCKSQCSDQAYLKCYAKVAIGTAKYPLEVISITELFNDRPLQAVVWVYVVSTGIFDDDASTAFVFLDIAMIVIDAFCDICLHRHHQTNRNDNHEDNLPIHVFHFLIIILINYSKIECLGHIIANGIQVLLYFIQNVQSKESFNILHLGLLPEFEVLRDYTTG